MCKMDSYGFSGSTDFKKFPINVWNGVKLRYFYRFLDWSIAKITLSWCFIVACRTVAYKKMCVYEHFLSNLFVPLLMHKKVLQFKSSFVSPDPRLPCWNNFSNFSNLCLLIARQHAMGVDVNLHFNINTILKGKKKTLQMKMSKFVLRFFCWV